MRRSNKKNELTANVNIPAFDHQPDITTFMSALYRMMDDPLCKLSDVALMINQTKEQYPNLEVPEIPDDVVDDLSMYYEGSYENGEGYDTVTDILREGDLFQTLDIVKMTKSQKEQMVQIPSMKEARFLKDIYYQTQHRRIVIENQLRAINKGQDNTVSEDYPDQYKNKTFMEWYLYNTALMEKQISTALAAFSDSCYLAQWAKQVKGIGPVIATCLAANLEIKPDPDDPTKTRMHAGDWWSYCGLNDNLRPWLSNKKATQIVESCIEKHGGIIDDNTVADICAETQWNIPHYERLARKNGKWDKSKLISASCAIPYRKDMKPLMFKIGHSFTLQQNREGSLYGRLLKERKAYETRMNEQGAFADQAKRILEENNYKTTTFAYQAYSQGKLPAAHIAMRAQRWATKLFISHLFEAAYYNKFGVMAPNPYVVAYNELHRDYIGPEVAYESIVRDCDRANYQPEA